MLKKVYMVLGFALGALFVWSLTHKARQTHAEKEEQDRKFAPLAARSRRRLAMKGAIDGVDYNSPDYWEQELAQYQDTFKKWEQGIFDDE